MVSPTWKSRNCHDIFQSLAIAESDVVGFIQSRVRDVLYFAYYGKIPYFSLCDFSLVIILRH